MIATRCLVPGTYLMAQLNSFVFDFLFVQHTRKKDKTRCLVPGTMRIENEIESRDDVCWFVVFILKAFSADGENDVDDLPALEG